MQDGSSAPCRRIASRRFKFLRPPCHFRRRMTEERTTFSSDAPAHRITRMTRRDCGSITTTLWSGEMK